jgi:3-hydroxyisobutyrate dehydrogenase-like beta-hydroxyacid dehydrogenase
MKTPHIGFLGFGEVGQRFAADLRAASPGIELSTFDLLLHQAAAALPCGGTRRQTGLNPASMRLRWPRPAG